MVVTLYDNVTKYRSYDMFKLISIEWMILIHCSGWFVNPTISFLCVLAYVDAPKIKKISNQALAINWVDSCFLFPAFFILLWSALEIKLVSHMTRHFTLFENTIQWNSDKPIVIDEMQLNQRRLLKTNSKILYIYIYKLY